MPPKDFNQPVEKMYNNNTYHYVKLQGEWMIGCFSIFTNSFHLMYGSVSTSTLDEVGDEVIFPVKYCNYIIGNYWFKRDYGDWFIISWDGKCWNSNGNKYEANFVNTEKYTLGDYIPYPIPKD